MSNRENWLSRIFSPGDSGNDSRRAGENQNASGIPVDWSVGQKLLDEFLVERVLGEGGMGKVYLVRNSNTGMQFAVKRAKGLSEKDRRSFLAELQTWIDLPEHPYLVPCRFFRTVDDEVLIFADYVEGGSLKEWIDNRKLYEGGHEKVLERMLDVAIQFAWGLDCLHKLGLVHQDVKPGNVLMELDQKASLQGVKEPATEHPRGNDACPCGSGRKFKRCCMLQGVQPRVTDYGLARSRAMSGEQNVLESGKSILVSRGGYTPAYCSPEQARRLSVSKKTDIWSWGVSVLEMFTGEVTWQSGQAAGEVLEQYLGGGIEKDPAIPTMPSAVAELLRRCFVSDPQKRCESLGFAVESLRSIYRNTVGWNYSRNLVVLERETMPQAGVAERRARNGETWTIPLRWLEKALIADGRDPGEATGIVAKQAASRRGQLVAELAAYDEARRIYELLVKAGRKELENDLATLCMEGALIHETADDPQGALILHDRAMEIWERLMNKEGRHELADNLAQVYINKGNLVSGLGDKQAAVDLYDRAIKICERLMNKKGRPKIANQLATAYMNKGIIVDKLGDKQAAVALYNRAMEIWERLVNQEGYWSVLADNLAQVYNNKGNLVSGLGDKQAAVVLYDRAIEIREQLVNQEGRHELADNLAQVYINKGNLVSGLGDKQAAVVLYDRAIEIREQLVNQEGRHELADGLARAYANKATILALDNKQVAVALCDCAIKIWERLVNQEGRRELANELAKAFMNKGHLFMKLSDNRSAMVMYDRAIEILERLVNQEGQHELMCDLVRTMGSRAIALRELGESKRSIFEAKVVISMLRKETRRTSDPNMNTLLDAMVSLFGDNP